MTGDLFTELRWLPRPPGDFEARLRALDIRSSDAGTALQALTAHGLDDNRLAKVARFVAKARAAGNPLPPLTPYSLGVITNSTTEFLGSAISGTAPRFGLNVECVAGAYDQGLQESMDPTSKINASRPKAVLIGLDWRGLGLRSLTQGGTDPESVVEAARERLRAIRAGIHDNSGAICIVQNLAPPAERVFGSLDRAVPGSLVSLVDGVNRAIAADLQGTTDVLFDVEALATTVGLASWHSPSEWNLAKLPFASAQLPLYADHLCRLLASMSGKSRRCLVLDLDNTMWGGVIGDDGVSGIRLSQGDADGEAYLEFQQYVLSLRDRGVVLAVSSKNEDLVARSPFREHPDMRIKEEHIAVFQANWNDKATNITAIARELSLGLQSLVFVDDNPFERELVRKALPEVAVVEMPEDPALYARTLSASGYFELTALSKEDLTRASMYEGNARRAELQKAVGNLDEYLASLDMEIVFQPFDDVGRARITQLINKSNQFNLTTRRYTEAEVEAVAADPGAFTLQVRLLDSFGDNGMISVIICRGVGGEVWEIDTWLMSCRVLGRKVEQMMLHELLRHASAHGATALVGSFIPTDRNGIVEEHYAKLEFELAQRDADGTTSWRMPVAGTVVAPPPMRVTRIGLP
ncbi:MAG: HAD-IIIC family phosphatase [bacterium]